MTRSGTRRWAKWIGTGLCLLLLGLWLLSGWYGAALYYSRRESEFVFIAAGMVHICWVDFTALPESERLTRERGHTPTPTWFEVQRRLDAPRFYWRLPEARPAGVQQSGATRSQTRVSVPLWLPFLAALLPTILLWRRDRSIPDGHCQKCGYDLTGNVSGRCPECGESVEGEEG